MPIASVVVQRTRVKICGVCRPEDAEAAAGAGADAVGLVFHPASPRNVPVDRAREVLAALPPFVTPVGLFVDADIDDLLRTVGELGLRHVQLHGGEPPEYVQRLARFAIIKAVRVRRDQFGDSLRTWRSAAARWAQLKGVVLETAGTSQAGGAGIPNDWDTVRVHRELGDFASLPFIAAGGLTPDTVGGVVRMLRPFAVDVSSGVEEAVGRKSEQKIRNFVAAVREADAS